MFNIYFDLACSLSWRCLNVAGFVKTGCGFNNNTIGGVALWMVGGFPLDVPSFASP